MRKMTTTVGRVELDSTTVNWGLVLLSNTQTVYRAPSSPYAFDIGHWAPCSLYTPCTLSRTTISHGIQPSSDPSKTCPPAGRNGPASFPSPSSTKSGPTTTPYLVHHHLLNCSSAPLSLSVPPKPSTLSVPPFGSCALPNHTIVPPTSYNFLNPESNSIQLWPPSVSYQLTLLSIAQQLSHTTPSPSPIIIKNTIL